MPTSILNLKLLPGGNVVLVGPPGAGKSTVAKRLANALHAPVIDTDSRIEGREGRACGEIFADLGEPAFRELEAEEVAAALRERGIISLGGGAILTPATRAALDGHVVIWIDVSVAEGVRRTLAENTRPVLAADDPAARYAEILSSREEFYRAVSLHRVHTDGRTPAQIVTNILGFLESLLEEVKS